MEELKSGLGTDKAKRAASPSPLLEAGLIFSAFWMRAYLPFPGGSPDLGQTWYHLGIAIEYLPKAGLITYLMARFEGPAAFGIEPRLPRVPELFRAGLIAAGTLVLAILPASLSRLLASFGLETGAALENPLLRAAGSASPLLLPLILLSCLSIGYGEELFFRFYLLKRFRDAGAGTGLALLFSALIFGSAHGAQGILGFIIGSLIGILYGLLRLRGGTWHELALGHAAYDASIMLWAVYGAGP